MTTYLRPITGMDTHRDVVIPGDGTRPGTTVATIPGTTAGTMILGTILHGTAPGTMDGMIPGTTVTVGAGVATTAPGTIVPGTTTEDGMEADMPTTTAIATR